MPNELVWNQFNGGWAPSDDAQSGRKNVLLRMDNVELDKNGSLSLIGGTEKLYTYESTTVDLYATTIGTDEVVYASVDTGKIYRDSTAISTGAGGDYTIATSGAAFGYTLLASGLTKLKDDGTNTYNLGLSDPPTISLTLVSCNFSDPLTVDGTTVAWGFDVAGTTGSQSTPSYSLTGIPAGNTYIKLFSDSNATPIDWTVLANGFIGSVPQRDDDLTTFTLMAGGTGDLSTITAVSLTFTVGTDGANYTASKQVSFPLTTSGYFAFRRSDFVANGGATGSVADWSNVLNFYITLTLTDNTITALDVDLSLTVIPFLAIGPFSDQFYFYRGLNTTDIPIEYSYATLAVAESNDYTALSSNLNAINNAVSIMVPPGTNVQVTIAADTDPQVTNQWVYRLGNDLGSYYRVIDAPNTAGNYPDTLSDQDALDIDLVLNSGLVSVRGGDLDKVYRIIGPIFSRWYYFSDKFMYPSPIDDPDLVDINLGIRTCGSDNEIFMWAAKVAEGYVLVGTSVDIYALSGTFATLPDGSVDIYYRPLTVQFPPITRQCSAANGVVWYLAADGWRSVNQTGGNSLLVAPNTDQLYNGVDRYGYTHVLTDDVVPGQLITPVIATKNKLFCCVNDRIEAYDFLRQYWRTFNYGLSSVNAITKSISGFPIAAFSSDNTSRLIDSPTVSTIDGTTKQSVSILSPVIDPSGSLNRNDLYTLKVRVITGEGENLICSLVMDDGTVYEIGTVTSFTDLPQQKLLDINFIIPAPTTTYQYLFTGTFSKLVISDARVDFDSRPNQLTALRLYNNNFGSVGMKRLRMWPHIVDTLGNEVRFTVYVDNTEVSSQVFTTNDKTTVPIFINSDAFGTDYGALLTGGPFEYWGAGGQPEVVQNTPAPKEFDQVGPQELFKYGKIREFEIRLLPLGGAVGTTSQFPITFYFDDFTNYTTELTVNNNQEQTYCYGVPKGTEGAIIRIELGPVTYPFIRYYVRVRAMVHGFDATDNSKWFTI